MAEMSSPRSATPRNEPRVERTSDGLWRWISSLNWWPEKQVSHVFAPLILASLWTSSHFASRRSLSLSASSYARLSTVPIPTFPHIARPLTARDAAGTTTDGALAACAYVDRQIGFYTSRVGVASYAGTLTRNICHRSCADRQLGTSCPQKATQASGSW